MWIGHAIFACRVTGNYPHSFSKVLPLRKNRWMISSFNFFICLNFEFSSSRDLKCLFTWMHTIDLINRLDRTEQRTWVFATKSTWRCKPLIFKTEMIWSNRIHILMYHIGLQDIGIRKSELKAKIKFLYWN